MSNYDPWEDTYDGSEKVGSEPEVGYQLLGILQQYAPNGEAQARCAEYLARMQRNDATPKEVALGMAGALVDGLRFGNWIWD